MTRPNFRAWTIEPAEFFRLQSRREQLVFLVRFAVLAPSSHNSQPWRFRLLNEAVELLPEPSRRLTVGDPDDNQLYVSLGCALEFLLIAARSYGLSPALEWFPGGDVTARIAFDWPAELPLQLSTEHLLHAMLTRSTNRNPHRPVPLPQSLLNAVQAEQNEWVTTFCITDPGQRRAVGELVVESTELCRHDRPFFRELAEYLLPNFSRKAVGMTGDTVGWNTAQSVLLPQAMKFMTPPSTAASERAKYCEHTAAYALVCARQDDRRHWLETGRSYARIALAAERLGVSSNNLAGPIGVADTRRRLAELVDSDAFPELCVRLGFCAQRMPHSPRLRAEQVIEAWDDA